MNERKITKIKAKREDTESIRIEFYNGLDGLEIMLVEEIGLDPNISLEQRQIIGLSIKYQEESIDITITGKCKIEYQEESTSITITGKCEIV